MKRTVRAMRVALWIGAVALAAASASGGESAERTLDRLQSWLDGADRLSGRFEQQLVSDAFGEDIVEHGRLFITRPGMMRWEYDDPERKLALVRGDETLLFLEEDEQLIRGMLDPEESALTRLLAGTDPLAALFDVAAAEVDGRGIEGLSLTPRGGSRAVEEVVLSVRKRDGAIVAAEILDPAGNRMRYRFPDLSRNEPFPADTFRFSPPPGTEILDGD